MLVLFLVCRKRCNPQPQSENSLWREGRVKLLAFRQPHSSLASLHLPTFVPPSEQGAQTLQTKASRDDTLASRRKASPYLSRRHVQCYGGPWAVPCCAGGAAAGDSPGRDPPTVPAAAEAKSATGDQQGCRNSGTACHQPCQRGPGLSPAASAGGGEGPGVQGSPGCSQDHLEMMVRTGTQVSGIRGVWGLQCLAIHTDDFFFLRGGGT